MMRNRTAKWLALAILWSVSAAWPGPLLAQAGGQITGLVTSEAGRPLSGASVMIEDTQQGALTGPDGRYSIGGVQPGQHSVRVSMVGYGPQTRSVEASASLASTADFQLQPQALELEGVVAVGYGTQRKRDVTGAVASVQVEDVPMTTIASVGQVLQGRVAGAQVIQNNGAPGAGISIRIRGTNSITANSEPLYVIDGVPAAVGSSSQDPYNNPLAVLNPQDIESIEILKDASSTAIYGARGANGVVLITTRQGRVGESRVTLESSYGIQSPARKLDMLGARQYAELANEARANADLPLPYTQEQIESLGIGTDWQSAVLRDAAQQSHTLSVSGGDERTRYVISGSYYDQEGIVLGSDFKRYSGRVNLDRRIGARLRVGTNFTASRTASDFQLTDNALGTGTVMSALWFNPAATVRDDAGNYVMYSPVTWPAGNPVALAEEMINRGNTSALVGNLFGEYDLLEGLRFRTSLGLNARYDRSEYYAPRNTPAGVGSNGSASASSRETLDLTYEGLLSYQHEVGPGHLDATTGFTVQTSRNDGVSASNSQFANDLTSVYDLGAGTRPQGDTDYSDWALVSYLGRANYSLRDRYLFTLTGRYDGSSRFGVNSKWGFFPSAAFAWRLIEEPFLQNQALFSDLKLRLSYGVTGNQEIGLYNSIARLSTSSYLFGGALNVGYSPSGTAPNPDLKWETTRQFNAGLDMGWFDNRITASVDAYHSTTDDLLLRVNLPSTSGFSNQLRNIGSVKNNGVELSLSTINLERNSFSWRSRLNLAANHNEVIDLGGVEEIPVDGKGVGGLTGGNTGVIREGESLGSFVGYEVDGIYQDGDACPLTTLRQHLDCIPGELRYVDTDGDGRINAADREILGYAQPDFYGGLANDLVLGRFDLNVFLQGSYGNEVLNGPGINLRNLTTLANQTTEALERWTAANPSTSVPRANEARPREITSRTIEDGSYLRLQSVTLGYQVPTGLLPAAASARIYVTGQNLHVWTDYTGFDPEVNSFGGDPALRGIDLGAYPRARTWNLGVNLTF